MQNLAADVRKNRPDVVLGFMGCMAQSRGQELIDKLPDVDLVLGTQKFHQVPDYLDNLRAARDAGVPLGAPGTTNMVRIASVGPDGDADM